MATNVYYTYNTLLTPGHADIELLTEAICLHVPTDRIRVHAQTVNVLDITVRENTHITQSIDDSLGQLDYNGLRTTIYAQGEERNIHL